MMSRQLSPTIESKDLSISDLFKDFYFVIPNLTHYHLSSYASCGARL